VTKKAVELGLTLENPRERVSKKRWTEEEDALLLPLITRPTSLYTAQELFPDRSYASVSQRIVYLRKREGFSRPQKPWTQDQDTELLRLNSLGHTASEIGVKFGRDYHAILYRIKKLTKS